MDLVQVAEPAGMAGSAPDWNVGKGYGSSLATACHMLNNPTGSVCAPA